jgi:uncharacterized protein (DUF362 family)
VKRRQFLKTTAVAAGAAAFAGIDTCAPKSRLPVTLLPMSDYDKDVSRDIAEAFATDGLNLKGKKVLLKPNFVEAHLGRPINTNPAVIASVAEACFLQGASQVTVGEASGHRRDPWFSVMNPALKGVFGSRVRRADLNHDDTVAVPNKGEATVFPGFFLPRTVVEADVFISMPKMKTHHYMGVTLSLKNLFGTLPGIYYGWPKNALHFAGVEESILDLARTIKIDYVVVDGVVGMEGDGPIMGTAKPVGVLVLSAHALAADATAARLMGFDPQKVPYIAHAGKFMPGLGQREVEYRGEKPRRFATQFDCLDEFKPMRGGPFF